MVSYRKAKYLKTLTNKLYISKLEVIENSFWSTDYAKKYSGYVRFAYLYLSPSSSKSHYGEIDGTIKSKKKKLLGMLMENLCRSFAFAHL